MWAPVLAVPGSWAPPVAVRVPGQQHLWPVELQRCIWLLHLPNDQPTPVCLPRESNGQRSLADYSPWGPQQLNTTQQLAQFT